jgi:hypothetical protein
MKDQRFFADVDLPFHVWIREGSGKRGFRWVLRHASEINAGGSSLRAASGGGDLAPRRGPGAPL